MLKIVADATVFIIIARKKKKKDGGQTVGRNDKWLPHQKKRRTTTGVSMECS
jgi:hypothetical protein